MAPREQHRPSTRDDLVRAVLAANGGKLPRTQTEVRALMKNTEFYAEIAAAGDRFDIPDPEHGFRNPAFPYKSAATPPGCMTQCYICVGQWHGPSQTMSMAYARNFTDEEAAKQIADLKNATANNLNYIRTLIDKHGNTIMKSWKKRSVKQREGIIRQAMPDLSPRKGFPLGEMGKNERKPRGSTILGLATKYRKSILMPYLDIETLSQEEDRLLALLYQRTRSKPADWAAFDSFQMEFSFRVPYLRTSYNPHCVQMHGGQYGKLVSWEKDASHRLDILGFPRAFLVFQAQHELSVLLRKFVDSFEIQSLPSEIRGRHQLDALVANGLVCGTNWAGRYDHAHSACSPPPKFDIEEITEVFLTRRMAAEDDLWLMQTDPAYLRAHFSRFEGAMVFQNSTKEEIRKFKSQIAMLPFAIWEGWDRLHMEAEGACRTLRSHGNPVKRGKPLPEQVEVALAGFEHALLEEFREQSDHIMTIILCSRTFRQHCTGTQGDKIVINMLGKDVHEEDPLFHHVLQLGRHNERMCYPATYHLGMLEHIMGNSKTQAARVDQLLLSALSSLVVINGALSAIRLHRPRNRPFEEVKHWPSAEHHVNREVWYSLFKDAQHVDHSLLYEPLEDFLRVPALPRRVNKQALVTFDKSHKALQRFWEAVRDRWSQGPWGIAQKICGPMMQFFAADVQQAISFSTTQAYLETVAVERRSLVNAIAAQESKAEAARAEAAAKLSRPYAPPQEVWGQGLAETFRPGVEKAKSKTRPLQPASSESNEERGEVTEAAEALRNLDLHVQVDSASYDIFQQMYDTRSEQHGDIRWEDFIAAMIDAGFSVTPSGGSVSTFKHAETGGSINFHRPHPDPSIDPVMLRVMGKRLNKWFNFGKDTFVERQKDEA